MKKMVFLFLLAFLLYALPASAAPVLPDVVGHWSEPEVQQAVNTGWVNGYPDGTFWPEKSITRAEFVKMIDAALKLNPDSPTERFLSEAAKEQSPALVDTGNHWLATQGWLGPALAFGLIVPSDYEENRFEPDRNICRREMAVIITRALGLVKPAQDTTPDLVFSDSAWIPAWARGYIDQAVKAGVIKGYEDNTFREARPATRAEAVVMINRALNWMNNGIDQNIKVLVRKPVQFYPDDPPQTVSLPVPAQVINGRVYVPVRAVFDTANSLLYNKPGSLRYYWDPVQQVLSFEYGVTYLFQAGNERWGLYSNLELNEYAPTLPAQARLLIGELMVPVFDPAVQSMFTTEWSSDTKTLTIEVGEPNHPVS